MNRTAGVALIIAGLLALTAMILEIPFDNFHSPREMVTEDQAMNKG